MLSSVANWNWWTRPGSNRGPHECHSCALPTALLAHFWGGKLTLNNNAPLVFPRLEKSLRHVGQVLPPERPHVTHVGHLLLGKLHALRFQPAFEFPVHSDEAIAGP